MTSKQVKAQAARYAKFVEWSDEDKCFIGRCPELMLGGVHGNDEAKVYAELCAAVEEMIEVIHAEAKEIPHPLGKKAFSGKFVLRVEPAIHRRLAAKALAAGESLTMDRRRGGGALISRGDHDLAPAQVQAQGPSRLGSQRSEPANRLCLLRWAANEPDLLPLTAMIQTP